MAPLTLPNPSFVIGMGLALTASIIQAYMMWRWPVRPRLLRTGLSIALLMSIYYTVSYAALAFGVGSFTGGQLLRHATWLVLLLLTLIVALARYYARRVLAENNRLRKTLGQLRLALARLESSNKELEQFAYVASHDLQEPLRMVSSFLGLLEQRYEHLLGDDGKEFIGFATDGARRMSRMIEGLLVYSRVSSEGLPFEQVDMNAALGGILQSLSVLLEERNAVVEYDPLPTICGDKAQLEHLLQNLVANALKFSSDQPVITLGANREMGHWVFWVSDNGIGIELQYQERIFNMFERLHPIGQYPGSGIGLSLCRRIVERHNGRIWVESELGKGSTFYFTVEANNDTTHKTDTYTAR